MKKKILFRADGNSEIGLGHLYRLFALVEMYKEDYEFTFITKNNSTISVIPKEYPIVILPQEISIEREPEWLAKKYNATKYIIIADGYQFISSYQKEIKKQGFQLMYIDDLTTEYMHADIVVNHSPSVKKEDFNSKKQTEFALGTEYAILRPMFIEATKQKRNIIKLDTAFICFGGSDMYNLSIIATKALLEKRQFKKIYIVLGAAYKHIEIFKLASKNKNIEIIQNASEKKMVSIMKQSNFAIAPASTILYELCCVKMPILSGYYVKNQELIYKGFLENKTIFEAGDFSTYIKEDFKNKINQVIKKGEYNTYTKAQEKLFNPKIKDNFLNLIKNKC